MRKKVKLEYMIVNMLMAAYMHTSTVCQYMYILKIQYVTSGEGEAIQITRYSLFFLSFAHFASLNPSCIQWDLVAN